MTFPTPFRRAALAGAAGLLALAALPAAVAQTVPLEEPGFTDDLTEKFRTALPDEHVIVVAPQRLTIGNAGAAVNLAGLARACHADPASCDRQAATFVAGAARTFQNLNKPPQPTQVRIALRSAAVADAYRANSRATGLNLEVQPFVDGLVSTVVIDTPSAMRWASSKDLDALKLDAAGLAELARANTHATMQPLASVAQPASHGQVGAIEGEDAYVASRVLFPADWAPMAKAQGGVLIVAVPRATAILYISDDSDDAVGALRAIAHQQFLTARDPLSDILLRWTPDGWQRLP
jgi:hypothetical protein